MRRIQILAILAVFATLRSAPRASAARCSAPEVYDCLQHAQHEEVNNEIDALLWTANGELT